MTELPWMAIPNMFSQFSCSVPYSLQPFGLQHTRLTCPSSTPRVYLNSCSLSRWCHPIISSSVIPFSSCLLSIPASGSFPMSQLFYSGGQSIGVSASASILPMYSGLISFRTGCACSPRDSEEPSTIWKHQFFSLQPSLWSNSHSYMTTGKDIALTTQTFVSKVMSLIFK